MVIRRFSVANATLSLALLLLLLFILTGGRKDSSSMAPKLIIFGGNTASMATHRKLLRHETVVEPNRIWGENCTKSDIVINQGPTAPLPNGIPMYTVEIMNVCFTGCDISGIHLSCGWFSSARLINPRIFKRLYYNDCLVNDGKPLANGGTLSFQYASTYLYSLSVSSVVC